MKCKKQYFLAPQVCILYVFSVADFPAGNVRVAVYSDGVPLSKAQLQYYSNMEEISCLLARVADPVDFMCQVKPLKGCFTSSNIYNLVLIADLSRYKTSLALEQLCQV